MKATLQFSLSVAVLIGTLISNATAQELGVVCPGSSLPGHCISHTKMCLVVGERGVELQPNKGCPE